MVSNVMTLDSVVAGFDNKVADFVKSRDIVSVVKPVDKDSSSVVLVGYLMSEKAEKVLDEAYKEEVVAYNKVMAVETGGDWKPESYAELVAAFDTDELDGYLSPMQRRLESVIGGVAKGLMLAGGVVALGSLVACDSPTPVVPDKYVNTVIAPVNYANCNTLNGVNYFEPVMVGNVKGVRMPSQDVTFDNCNINTGQVDIPESKGILTGKYKMNFVPLDGDFVELETLLRLNENSYDVFEGDKGVFLIASDKKTGYADGVHDVAFVSNETDGSQPGPKIDAVCVYDVSQFERETSTSGSYHVANTKGMSSARVEHIKALAALAPEMSKGKCDGRVLLESRGEVSAAELNSPQIGKAYFFNKTNPHAGIDLEVARNADSDIYDADWARAGMTPSDVDGKERLGQITAEMQTILYGNGVKVLVAEHGRRTIGEDNMPLQRTIDLFSQMYLHPSGMTFEDLGNGLYKAVDARILREH